MPFPPEVEQVVKTMYRSLRENDRRRYAAIEAAKLGHGGVDYIARVLKCDPKTIRQGQVELNAEDDLDTERVRKKGGGRKRLIADSPALEENFSKVLQDHTAGDPIRAEV